MSRIAGNPKDKLAYLSFLDQKSLPYLAGDILFFLHNHKNVKIVEGPGDGKRDVHSITPNNEKHITQCKFHNKPTDTASTDETDELVLALHKFGCKNGLFVTTGRISPQAKREYIDYYKDFDLDFLDGIDIVDTVLASPVLSAAWFDGNKIVKVKNSLRIPFIIRRVQDDKPIVSEVFTLKTYPDINHDYKKGSISLVDFEPYRPPANITFFESGSSSFQGYYVICSGDIHIYNISEHAKLITNNIAQLIKNEDLPVIIRVGKPSLIPNIKTQNFDSIPLSSTKSYPCSFVIDKARNVIFERDWFIVQQQKDWLFPKRISTLQREEAGWINKKTNTIIMLFLMWPDIKESYVETIYNKLTIKYFKKSIFLSVNSILLDEFLKSLSKNQLPDFECNFGPNGKMLCWYHPALKVIENGFLLSLNQDENSLEGDFTTQNQEKKFEQLRKKILDSKFEVMQLDFEKARLISAISEKNLIPEKKNSSTFSAEMYHFFSDIPSPVYSRDRKLVFIQVWKIDDEFKKVKRMLTNNPIKLQSSYQPEYNWVLYDGPTSQSTYCYSTLTYEQVATISTNDFLAEIIEDQEKCLQQIAETICNFWHAELVTEQFWRDEIDILF